jgi:hypothetical protein
MTSNLLLGCLSLALAISPFISRIRYLNEKFQLFSANGITGVWEMLVIGAGAAGLVICLHLLFVGKKNGAPYIVIGMIVTFVSFFFNGEILPKPLPGVLLGGDIFFAFAISLLLAISGVVVEWLT